MRWGLRVGGGSFFLQRGSASDGTLGGSMRSFAQKGVCSLFRYGRRWPVSRRELSFTSAATRWATFEEGRLLVVSPVSQLIRRVDMQSAAVRNRFILETAQRVVFAALDPEGAFSRMLAVHSNRNISFNVL